MNEKIDLTDLLKGCPSGMELDCLMYEDVHFDHVDELNVIHCYIQYETYKTSLTFNQYGTFNSNIKSKCVIFPKGKTTWEGFQRPFVDGDIITSSAGCVAIFSNLEKDNRVLFHCLYGQGVKLIAKKGSGIGCSDNCRFATEHEKEILFTALKDNGYKWDPETKTLEKLIVPKFKVGDSIQSKTDNNVKFTITNIDNNKFYYGCEKGHEFMIPVVKQDNWELAPNKFNPNTLQPFDKVLMTDGFSMPWSIGFFSHIMKSGEHRFVVGSSHWRYCIPYNNDTKHLIGKTDEAPKFYQY